MNDIQWKRGAKIGIVLLGLIPVLLLCQQAYCGWFLARQGVNLAGVIMDPPAGFAMCPMLSAVLAVCILGWNAVLVSRTATTLGHLCVYYSVMLLLTVTLILEAMRLAGFTPVLLKNGNDRSPNNALQIDSDPAPRVPSV